jgi:glycosyltransferase involved in cell wall biosynthesis
MEPTIPPHEPLKILMASGVPKRREGGVAAMIYNLGREIEKRGHQVSYLFQEDLVEPGSVSPRFTELAFSFRLSRYIAKNRGKFSLVNLHAPVGFPYGFRRRWSLGVGYPPYVMTLHGLEERRVHVMSREAKKGRVQNYSLKNRMWQRFYHLPRFSWSIRTANGAHVVARDTATMLQLKYNLDSDRVAYIPGGVDERFFIERQYRAGSAVKLLYAGTWLEQRGIYYLRDALRALAANVRGISMTFAGCGTQEQAIREFFGPELSDAVVVRPVVSSEAMQELYAEHDVFLFPSLMEGMPLVLLEAMATGMSVITTETCGMPDVVESEFNGLLIPPANAKAIEGAVMKLAESGGMRKRLGVAAQQTMRRYTWARSAERLDDFFQHILELERRSA